MLDQRPIPRYLLGFPSEVQENILRTVESQLKEMTDVEKPSEDPSVNVTPEMRLEFAETLIQIELESLKALCREKK